MSRSSQIALGSWVSMFFRPHFDVWMRAGPGYESRLVERPGKWMGAEALAALAADLRRVAAHTLPSGELTYGVFSGDRSRLEHSIVTIVYRRADRVPVAFNALAVMDLELAGRPVQVLHLGLVMVDPAVRGQGLSWVLYGLTCFLVFLRNQLRPLWISSVTQVPAVVGMVSDSLSDVFPSPLPGTRRSMAHLLLARQIMRHNRHVFGVGPEAGFDEDRFVITDAYTGGSDALKKSYQAAAKHRDDQFNRFCAGELDYDRGDDFLQLGRMDLKAARAWLSDAVPRNSLAALALVGATVVLQRAVLPVVHWLDAGRQWGILRPWRR